MTHSISRDPIAAYKRTQIRKHLVHVLVFVAMLGVLVYLYILITGEVLKIRTARAEQQWLYKNFDVIAQLNAGRSHAEESKIELGKIIPSIIDLPTKLLPVLRGIAQLHNVKMELELSNDATPISENLVSTSFTLKADGGLRDLELFLIDLESQKNIVNVQGWDFEPLGSNQSHHLTLNGLLYSRP